MIVARRAVGERPQPPQQVDPRLAEQGDLGDMLRTRQRGRQAQQQDLLKGIGDLALLTRVRQVLEVRQKSNRLGNRRHNRVAVVHDPFLPRESKERIDSALYGFVTTLFTRLPWQVRIWRLIPLIFLLPSTPRSPFCGPDTTLCESRMAVEGSAAWPCFSRAARVRRPPMADQIPSWRNRSCQVLTVSHRPKPMGR